MKSMLFLISVAAMGAAMGAGGRELLPNGWGNAYSDGEIQTTPEGRVFRAPHPNSGVKGELRIGDDWGIVELSCEYRAKDIVRGEKFYMNGRILQQFNDANGKKTGPWPNTLGVEGTTDGWKVFRAKNLVPPDAKTYSLNFGNIAKSGWIEYRNVSLKLVRTKADLLPHDEPLPEGFAGDPFSLDDAWRETTPTRERICLNGLWRARPSVTNDVPGKMPAVGDCWGWMKVPHVWASKDAADLLSPWFAANRVGTVAEAHWLKRKLTVPASAAGRRIVLTFTALNSKAVVYVDGREAATVAFPGGEADLTDAIRPGVEQEIALFVTAWPANWEKGTFDGPLDERTQKSTDHAVKKSVERKGITGDLYLDLLPKGNRIVEAYAECDSAKREVTFVVRTERAAEDGVSLAAEVEGCGAKRTFEGSGTRFAASWPDAKPWDLDHPGNLYTCRLTLRDASGRAVDAALPFRFGFRDVKTKGRDLLLNGKAVHLRGLYNNSWTREPSVSCKQACRELVSRLRDDGVNFIIAGNYAVQPGQFTYLDALLDACDEGGVLYSVTLPHLREFDWAIEKDADRRARFTALTAWMIARVRNHPSVVTYAMTHNRIGYCGDIDPERMNGTYEFPKDKTPPWVIRKQGTARFAASIARSIDPTRPIYHHEGGNLDDFHCCNIYLNWSPVQERSEWIRDWAENGVKPLVFVEWGLPHIGSWSSYRGPLFIWTRPAFQSLWAAEYASAFRGDAAFDASDAGCDALAEEERLWAKREPFFFGRTLARKLHPWRSNFQQIQADFLSRNLPDFRAWGLTEFLPWDQGGFYELVTKRAPRANPDALANLKAPGIVPDVFPQQEQYWYDTGARSDFQVSEVGRAWRAGFRPLLGFVGGDGLFTDRRHGYRVGEAVKKTLVVVNDLAETAQVRWSCAFGAERREGELAVESGKTAFVPVEFKAAKRGMEKLIADFRFGNGETRRDEFRVDVYPEPKVAKSGEVALYDPKGLTAANFRRLGIAFRLVDASVAVGDGGGETFVYESGSGADQVRVAEGMKLVIGRESLTPAIMNRLLVPALRAKAKVLVFEQTRETLESVGFRVQEYGLRNAFPRYRDGRVKSAEDVVRLHDWAGEATLVKPRFEGLDEAELSYPRRMTNGFFNWRVWRCGSRGSVASVIIEKPSMGDWRARVDGGFNLQYTPLADWIVEQGVATFCQMDVTARTVAEPAADDLVRELVASLSRKPDAAWGVQAAGMDAMLACRDYGVGFNPDPLAAWTSRTLVASTGAKKPDDFERRIKSGGVALCLGFTAEEVKAWSPVPVKVAETNGCFYTRIEKLPAELNGLSNADWAWHGAMDFAAFTEPAEDGNAAFRVIRYGKGKLVFWQVPPWKVDDRAKPYLRVSRRRADAMLARLIHNLGVTSKVYGVHYLDAPVAEDDPYRYVRW